MLGTVVRATNSVFGLGRGVLASSLMKKLVWELLPPPTKDTYRL